MTLHWARWYPVGELAPAHRLIVPAMLREAARLLAAPGRYGGDKIHCATIEGDGAVVMIGHVRQLETVAAQCLRRR